MALICPACGTENRSVAKFCIECIGALPMDFAPTQLAPRPASGDRVASEGMPSALAAFASSPPPLPKVKIRAGAPPQPESKGRKGLWVSVGALAIALIVGAAGWAAAGAGGWYIYKAKTVLDEREPAVMPPPVSVAEPVRESAAAPGPAPASPSASAPASASASAPTVASTLAPGETLVTAAATDRGQKAALKTEERADRPVVATAARAVEKPRAAAARVHAASTLESVCGGMNFIAASRCKVAECEKPEWRQATECRAVQAQQRLMEEKRNPTLIN